MAIRKNLYIVCAVLLSTSCAFALAPPQNFRIYTGQPEDPSGGYVHGENISPLNTGWRGLGLTVGDLTPHNGIFNQSGTYENLDIQGEIVISANNVTIRGFRVTYTGALYGVRYNPTWGSSFSGTVLEYGEIAGPGSSDGNTGGIGLILDGNGQTLRRLHIHDFRVGTQLYGDDLVENSYVEDLAYSDGSHNTSWSIRGSNVTVRGNHLTDGNSAAMSIYAVGPIHNVLAEDNFWQTPNANYCLNFGPDKAGYSASTNWVIINNVFGQDHYSTCGSSGPQSGFPGSQTGMVWTGNEYADGTPIN